MEKLSSRLDAVQEELLTLYETGSNTLQSQIKHWSLIRQENVLQHFARRQGITRLGMQAIPHLNVSQEKAKQAIEMMLHLTELQNSPYADEDWTLSNTSREAYLAPPANCFKKGAMQVTVWFDGDKDNACQHTAWKYVYYQDGDSWTKTEGGCDYHGLFYREDGYKRYYHTFIEDADRYGTTGIYEVEFGNEVISPPIVTSSTTDGLAPADPDWTDIGLGVLGPPEETGVSGPPTPKRCRSRSPEAPEASCQPSTTVPPPSVEGPADVLGRGRPPSTAADTDPGSTDTDAETETEPESPGRRGRGRGRGRGAARSRGRGPQTKQRAVTPASASPCSCRFASSYGQRSGDRPDLCFSWAGGGRGPFGWSCNAETHVGPPVPEPVSSSGDTRGGCAAVAGYATVDGPATDPRGAQAAYASQGVSAQGVQRVPEAADGLAVGPRNLLRRPGHPVVTVLKGGANQLKCLRYRIKKQHCGLYLCISSTWHWTGETGVGRQGRARVLVVFPGPEEAETFMKNVSLPKGVQACSGYAGVAL